MIKLLHQSVLSAAQANPDSLAFCCGDQQLTYGQLDQYSSQLANFLVGQGSKQGSRIGVFMPRCVETMVAVYGILKAGCIFVPIDPNLSAGGVATLVNNCEIRTLLTHPKKSRLLNQLIQRATSLDCLIGAADGIENAGPVRVFGWDAFDGEKYSSPADVLIEPDDPAYIMYSSGSTGRPKGITHTHFSGLSYCRLSADTYQVSSQDVIANHSPISFDMSTFGYFTSCMAGATTVLIPEAHTKFPSSLAKLMEQQRITIWYSVPLALIQLLQRTKLTNFDLSSIRWVKFGGEPFPPGYLRALMKAWPNARFSNVYGPAEVNQCTFYHVPPEYADDENDSPIPIGKTWNETDGVILDHEGQPVSDGQAGELLISSPTMMQGYWGNGQRTKNAFCRLKDQNGNSRVYYRTGDIVKRQSDGNLLFLRRKDRQIKIRGYRIELDEVEHLLNGLDEIEEAAVFCVVSGDAKEIHATAINKTGCRTDQERIKSQLGEALSPYAIPSVIQLVKQLPRTNSGKIDRNRLANEAGGVTTS